MTRLRGMCFVSNDRALLLALFAGLAVACSNPAPMDAGQDAATDAVTDAVPRPDAQVTMPGACVLEGQAPLRTGDGGFECTAVGAAHAGPSEPVWPNVAMELAPVAYVRPGAVGGHGTTSEPFGTIAIAMAASPTARTIALPRGSFVLTNAVDVMRDLTIVGTGTQAGEMGTTLQFRAGINGISARGSTTHLDVHGVALTFGAPSEPCATTTVGISATTGATVTLNDVEIDRAGRGLNFESAVLVASNTSVLHACDRGMFLFGDTHARLRGVLVSDGAGPGILVEESSLDIERGMVRNNVLDGIALLGGIAAEPDSVRSVAMIHNGVTGLRVEQSSTRRPVTVTARLLAISGTQGPPGGGPEGGDGIYIGPGGTVALDTNIVGDDHLGFGSEVIGNVRSGILVAGTPGAGPVGQMTMSAALIASNLGPGVYIQDRALVESISYSRVIGNSALGVGVTSAGRLNRMFCDDISETRVGTIVTAVGTLTVGDGLSIAETNVADSTIVMGSVFEHNERFALLLSAATATLENNRGGNNGYPIGSYGSTVNIGSSNAITAQAESPVTPLQTTRGQLLDSL